MCPSWAQHCLQREFHSDLFSEGPKFSTSYVCKSITLSKELALKGQQSWGLLTLVCWFGKETFDGVLKQVRGNGVQRLPTFQAPYTSDPNSYLQEISYASYRLL